MYPPPLAPVRSLATAASALVLAVCAVNLVGTWAAWNAHSVVVDYLAGAPEVTDGDLEAADDATTGVGWTSLLVMAVSAAVFLTWLWRARVNSEHLSDVQHRLSRGWTIGAWFCPIVNLWFPRRIVDDVWRASSPAVPATPYGLPPLSPLVRAWWLIVVVDYAMTYLYRVGTRNREVTVDLIKTDAIRQTISTVLVIVSGVLLIKVIRQITEWQSAPRRAAPEGLPNLQAPPA